MKGREIKGMMSIFEAIMIASFGAAWPFSIYKSYTSRSNVGKSIFFLFVILIGYSSGILHKLIYNFDSVIYLYVLNFCLVLTDIILYFRNKRIND